MYVGNSTYCTDDDSGLSNYLYFFIAGNILHGFGGAAVVFESGIEKLLRDARTGSIGEGQNDIVRLMASLDL